MKSDAWKRYTNLYPYLLGYELNDSFPYKQLAKQYNLKIASIQHMVRYMQSKPEVIAFIRAQYSPDSIPAWVGDLEGTTDYRGYLHSVGITLPDEAPVSPPGKMGDVGGDHGDESDSEVESPTQALTLDANHIESEAPRGTQTTPATLTQTHPPRPTREKPDNRARRPRDDTQKKPDLPSRRSRDEQETEPEDPSHVKPYGTTAAQPTFKNAPPPPVKVESKAIPLSPSEKMKTGEATLEEEPSLKKAKQIVAERLGGSQAHGPNMVQLPEGGWGTLVQKQDGGYIVVQVQETPPTIEADDDFESAVNTVTREELKIVTLAMLKKVAFSPSTVMGYAYIQSMKTEEGVPYFVGDIGDFANYCIKFTLKFGFGAEFAIVTGKPTLSDVFKANAEANN
jgi:hypothetical protein